MRLFFACLCCLVISLPSIAAQESVSTVDELSLDLQTDDDTAISDEGDPNRLTVTEVDAGTEINSLTEADNDSTSVEPIERIGQAVTESVVGSDAEAEASPNQVDFGSFLDGVDFDSARISQAGPDALYVRGVIVRGVSMSLLFKMGEDNVWRIAQAVSEESNFFPEGIVLDFARLAKMADGSIQIDGILIGGKPYSTTVQVTEDNGLMPGGSLVVGSLIGSSLGRAREVAALAFGDELAELDTKRTENLEYERLNKEMLANIGNLEALQRGTQQEKEALVVQLRELESRNSALATEVDLLKKEVETLGQTAVATESTGNDGASSGSDMNNPETVELLKTLSKHIEDLETQIAALDAHLTELSSGQAVNSTTPQTGTITDNSRIEALETELKRLTVLNESLMAERQEIERKIRDEFIASGYIQTLKPSLTQQVLRGFTGAEPRIGEWNVAAETVSQTDPNQYFAQLDLALLQEQETMLYRFKVKSSGNGWVGLGLHIYASGADKRGYGHGKSLLIWLTRDPDHYKNERTYLQLYRSDDDVNMGRVLDSAIEEHISQELVVEVLYQPKEEYITVAIDGVEKIRYKTWFGINEGVEVALRSLGVAQFGDLEVYAEAE